MVYSSSDSCTLLRHPWFFDDTTANWVYKREKEMKTRLGIFVYTDIQLWINQASLRGNFRSSMNWSILAELKLHWNINKTTNEGFFGMILSTWWQCTPFGGSRTGPPAGPSPADITRFAGGEPIEIPPDGSIAIAAVKFRNPATS